MQHQIPPSSPNNGAPYFQKNEMEIESGYPSEGEARTGAGYERPMIETSPQQLEVLNESRLSYKEPLMKAQRVS